MTCTERKDALLLYALDALDPGEREEMSEHLGRGCPECAGSLAEAQNVLTHLALAAPPIAPPAAVKERVMAEVTRGMPEGRREGRTVLPFEAPRRTRTSGWLVPVVSAGLAAVVTAVALLVPARKERDRLETVLAQQATRIEELEATAQAATESIRLLRSPRVEVVSLQGQGAQSEAAARIFWDKSRGVWQFFASNLKPAGPGKTYELWFITTDQKKIKAGIFDVDEAGEGALVVQVPQGLGPIALAAVTDEPAGGVDQPTGSIHLLGKV